MNADTIEQCWNTLKKEFIKEASARGKVASDLGCKPEDTREVRREYNKVQKHAWRSVDRAWDRVQHAEYNEKLWSIVSYVGVNTQGDPLAICDYRELPTFPEEVPFDISLLGEDDEESYECSGCGAHVSMNDMAI